MANDKPIIIDNPEGIAYARLASCKGAVKLEKVGLKSRGGSVRKMIAVEMGMKATATHDDVIAEIQRRMDLFLLNKQNALDLDITPEQLTALKDWIATKGADWKAKLYESWITGGNHSAYLQQLRNQKGPAWLEKLTVEIHK